MIYATTSPCYVQAIWCAVHILCTVLIWFWRDFFRMLLCVNTMCDRGARCNSGSVVIDWLPCGGCGMIQRSLRLTTAENNKARISILY
mmetsp:Transcript_14613/g.33800  ORF Transcript_14613/g.33800 Transcript_14613/m.33800 type:complete len:88 (-) Transcript_14613:70-333(-)